MKTEILKNGNLKLIADSNDITELRELQENNPDDFTSDNIMYEFMEEFIGNSEYDFITPESIGALTDAPILGVTDENDNVITAYGFMDYAIIALHDQLLQYGQAVLVKA